MNEQEVIQQLKDQGYDKVYAGSDKPNAEDPAHQHDFATHLVILRGSIDIFIGSKKTTVRAGETFDVPRNTVHAAKTGPEGLRYIAAERH